MADDNKPMKYMRYAIGEIALVVIGILIALQINNWNEKRKSDIERAQLQKSLHDDLVLDTLLINQNIKSYKESLKYINSLYDRMYSGDANLDTIKFIVQKEYKPGLKAIRNFNSATFNSMESSGKLDLLQSNLKSSIVKHYLTQKESIQMLDITVQSNVKMILDFNKVYSFQWSNDDSYMAKMAWGNIDERDFVMRFNGVISYHQHARLLNISTYIKLLNSTRDLLTLLNNSN